MTLNYTEEEFLEIEQRLNNQRFKEFPSSLNKDTPDPGLESKLLSRCTEHLRKNNIKYFHDYSRGINEPGILDLYIFFHKKRLVVIELKSETGRHSKEQKEWISYLLYHGYEVHQNVRSYKRFIGILYGKD